MTNRPFTLSTAALLTALLVTSCATSTDGSLNTQASTPSPTCLVHQKKEPSDRYTAGKDADTRSVLALLRYYTANGNKAFCDGKPPTTTDRHWMSLYTTLGGKHSHVTAKQHPTS